MTKRISIIFALAIVIVAGLLALSRFSQNLSHEMWEELAFFPQEFVQDIHWHPNSQKIAVAGSGVTVYSIHSEYLDYSYIELAGGVTRVINWSSDGSLLAIGGNKVWLWDGNSSTELVDEASYRVYSDVAWTSSDEKVVAVSHGLSNSDNLIWIWDPETFQLIGTMQGHNTLQYTNPVGDMGFISIERIGSSDLFVTSSWGNNANRFWDISLMRAVSPISVGVSNSTLISSNSSGSQVAIVDTASNSINIKSINTTSETDVLESKLNQINVLEWHDLGKLLLVGDLEVGKLVVWSIEQGDVISSIDISNTDNLKVDWHPENNIVAIASNQEVLVWDLDSNEINQVHSGFSSAVQWSPDGLSLATVSRQGIHIYVRR